ncbi:MAG: hypothetical protein M0R39_11790 [Prolixibacteraceae bacterium]|nr:hypothetical protein [Prolixibacteraceae bacterium]
MIKNSVKTTGKEGVMGTRGRGGEKGAEIGKIETGNGETEIWWNGKGD